MGIPDRKEKEKRIENIFEEIMSENFPNLKETSVKMQEAQRAPNMLKANIPTPKQIIVKMAKIKDKQRILKAARKSKVLIIRYPHKAIS